MSSPPDDPEPPFTLDELAELRSGGLTAVQEESLRMRIEQDPDRARRMLAALDTVDAAFPDPPNLDDPLQVPPEVDARWQAAIARATERRAHGLPPDDEDDDGDQEGSPQPGRDTSPERDK